MKKINKLLGSVEITLTLSVILYIACLIPVHTVKRLTDSELMLRYGTPCLYDVIMEISVFALWKYILPIVLFYILYLLKYELNSAVVIRMKSVRTIWISLQKNIVCSSFFFSLYITIITFIEGYFMTGEICNWNDTNSKAYEIVMRPLSNIPELWEITIAYAVGIYAALYVSSTILMYIWWLTDKSWLGYMVAICILTIENLCKKGYLYRYYTFSMAYYEGINVYTNILYPLALSIVLMFITPFIIRRKDFLK